MESLRWIFKLYDGMSGPADAMTKSLGGVLSALDALPNATALAQQGFSMLISGVQKLASIVFDSGKFVFNALAFKESTLESFRLMLGTKEAAAEAFNTAKGFGKLTPFETTDVVDAFRKLSVAGFSQKEIPIVFQALGDVAAGSGFNKQLIDQLTIAFAQIKAKGKLQGDDFRQLMNAGLSAGEIGKNAAKMMGIDPKDFSKAMEGGKVSADVALAAVMDHIQQRFSAGQLGKGMLTQATTLKGLFSTLASAPMDMFLDIDLDNSPGFKGLKKFMQSLVDALNPDSITGSKLKGVLEGVVNDIGSLLGGVSIDDLTAGFDTFVTMVTVGIQGLGAFKDSVMQVLQPTIDLMSTMDEGQGKGQGFVDVMSVLGYVLGGILNVILLVGLGIGKAFEGFKLLGDIDWSYLGDQLMQVGKDLLEGLAKGILGALGIPVDALMTVGQAIIGTAKDVLGIHSPSAVFAELGAYTAEGFAQGVDNAQGQVSDSLNTLVKVPDVGGGGARGPISVSINIPIEGGSGDPETIARKLKEILATELASVFEQLGIEGGVA